MPILNARISVDGPIIEVGIGISAQRAAALGSLGLAVPPLATVRGLVDTGATCTCVDPGVVVRLGLTPTGVCQMISASSGTTPHVCNQYDVSLLLFADNGQAQLVALTIPVIEAELDHQGFQVLIGRDVLDHGLMVYNGKGGELLLAF